jgi:hypothetical protein
MKKVMVVMTMFVTLSFLVSMIAVAPAFAKQATQTQSTTKQVPQQGPAQAPQTPTVKSLATPTKTYEKPKSVFWDLAVDRRCVANGVTLDPVVTAADYKIPFLNNKIVGKCFYKVKTPSVNEITEADVKKWGSGNLTYFGWVTLDGKRALGPCKIKVAKILPKFTWEDVQRWKKVATGNAPRIWNESIDFTCTAESQGDYRWFYFKIETQYIGTPIPEYDTGNNKCDTNIQLFKSSEFQGTQNKHKAVSQ